VSVDVPFFYRGPKLHPTKITTLRPHPLTILCQTENMLPSISCTKIRSIEQQSLLQNRRPTLPRFESTRFCPNDVLANLNPSTTAILHHGYRYGTLEFWQHENFVAQSVKHGMYVCFPLFGHLPKSPQFLWNICVDVPSSSGTFDQMFPLRFGHPQCFPCLNC
jgi:hypothetical protein